MQRNVIICRNQNCPNNRNRNCDRTYVIMDPGGRCLSAKQAAGDRQEEQDDEESGTAIKRENQ